MDLTAFPRSSFSLALLHADLKLHHDRSLWKNPFESILSLQVLPSAFSLLQIHYFQYQSVICRSVFQNTLSCDAYLIP